MILFVLSMPGSAPAAESYSIRPYLPIGQGTTTLISASSKIQDLATLH